MSKSEGDMRLPVWDPIREPNLRDAQSFDAYGETNPDAPPDSTITL